VVAAELLLELTDEVVLDLVESLEKLDGDKDNEGLASGGEVHLSDG